ncbi:MAG: hypothetical protein K1Y36_13005 [Blastocatellia bacterium]|nr:hypothetical protein [Blastocatellia bacterium]
MSEPVRTGTTGDLAQSPDQHTDHAVLTEQASSYFKLLTVLRKQLSATGAGAQVGVVATIARWLDSPPILTLIARTEPWFVEWDIKQALYANLHTPRRIHDEIGRIITIFELMRELDQSGLAEQDKNEIREDIKALFGHLSPNDKALVKARAYKLSSSSKRTTAELPPVYDFSQLAEYSIRDLMALAAELDTEEQPAEAEIATPAPVADLKSFSPEDAITVARTTTEPVLLAQALDSYDEEMLQAALGNPNLTSELVLGAAETATHVTFFRLLPRYDQWYLRTAIRTALLKNPNLPTERRKKLEISEQILLLFDTLDQGGEKAQAAAQVMGLLVDRLSSEDLAYVLETVKEVYPHLSYLLFSTPEFSGEFEPLPAHLIPAPAPVRDEPLPPALSSAEIALKSGIHASLTQKEALSQQSTENRLREAASTTDIGQLAILMSDPDNAVFEALLGNPALPEDMVVGYGRTISAERVETLHRHPRWSARLRINEVLLDNPNTPHVVSLAILRQIGDLRTLLKLLKNPKIKAVEIKQTAHQRLVERYRALGASERVAVIKDTNGEILHELWEEAFHDEATMTTLLKEQFLDESVVLRVVRSKSAPRQALAEIGANQTWVNNYQIRLDLVMNPKTPREVVARLIGRLSPADRSRIKNNRGVPEHVRAMM